MTFDQWWKVNKYEPHIPRTFFDYSRHAWDACDLLHRLRTERMEKALRRLIDIYDVADEYEGDRRAELIERYFKGYVGE